MVTAFALSAVFLVGYLSYHYVHGDTRYTGTGAMRAVYLTVLASHIVLSITVVPGALTAFYFALTRQFERHRRLNRVFLPIWLYVSVTGVAIYFMLRGWHGPAARWGDSSSARLDQLPLRSARSHACTRRRDANDGSTDGAA